MQAGGFFTGNGRKTKEGAPLDIKDTLNELLVKLFRNINTIEEQAIRTEEYRDMTTNDMHVIEAIGTGAAKNMTSVAKTLEMCIRDSLSDALDAIDGFTKKLTSAVRVGEETGSLDSMLNSIADSMEFESNMAIDKMVATLEPVLIVVMAIIVGFIMVSVLMPIYGSYDAISNSGY